MVKIVAHFSSCTFLLALRVSRRDFLFLFFLAIMYEEKNVSDAKVNQSA